MSKVAILCLLAGVISLESKPLIVTNCSRERELPNLEAAGAARFVVFAEKKHTWCASVAAEASCTSNPRHRKYVGNLYGYQAILHLLWFIRSFEIVQISLDILLLSI